MLLFQRPSSSNASIILHARAHGAPRNTILANKSNIRIYPPGSCDDPDIRIPGYPDTAIYMYLSSAFTARTAAVVPAFADRF